MYIRMKIGRDAGNIIDVAPDRARQLIANGKAEDARSKPLVDPDDMPSAIRALKGSGLVEPVRPEKKKKKR